MFFRWLKPPPIFQHSTQIEMNVILMSAAYYLAFSEGGHCHLWKSYKSLRTRRTRPLWRILCYRVSPVAVFHCIGTSSFWHNFVFFSQVEPEVTPTSCPGWSRWKLSSWRWFLWASRLNMLIVVDNHLMVNWECSKIPHVLIHWNKPHKSVTSDTSNVCGKAIQPEGKTDERSHENGMSHDDPITWGWLKHLISPEVL